MRLIRALARFGRAWTRVKACNVLGWHTWFFLEAKIVEKRLLSFQRCHWCGDVREAPKIKGVEWPF